MRVKVLIFLAAGLSAGEGTHLSDGSAARFVRRWSKLVRHSASKEMRHR